MVGNLVGGEGRASKSDENEVLLVLRSGEFIPLPRASKREIADRIFDQILKLRLALHAADDARTSCASIWSITRTWGSKRSIADPSPSVPDRPTQSLIPATSRRPPIRSPVVPPARTGA